MTLSQGTRAAYILPILGTTLWPLTVVKNNQKSVNKISKCQIVEALNNTVIK